MHMQKNKATLQAPNSAISDYLSYFISEFESE